MEKYRRSESIEQFFEAHIRFETKPLSRCYLMSYCFTCPPVGLVGPNIISDPEVVGATDEAEIFDVELAAAPTDMDVF
uniref:Uncharacterized protein n=1 Tax=Romanomermis culicivorax TaxID=13658 RepID=A0A915JA94_ROMCU